MFAYYKHFSPGPKDTVNHKPDEWPVVPPDLCSNPTSNYVGVAHPGPHCNKCLIELLCMSSNSYKGDTDPRAEIQDAGLSQKILDSWHHLCVCLEEQKPKKHWLLDCRMRSKMQNCPGRSWTAAIYEFALRNGNPQIIGCLWNEIQDARLSQKILASWHLCVCF